MKHLIDKTPNLKSQHPEKSEMYNITFGSVVQCGVTLCNCVCLIFFFNKKLPQEKVIFRKHSTVGQTCNYAKRIGAEFEKIYVRRKTGPNFKLKLPPP